MLSKYLPSWKWKFKALTVHGLPYTVWACWSLLEIGLLSSSWTSTLFKQVYLRDILPVLTHKIGEGFWKNFKNLGLIFCYMQTVAFVNLLEPILATGNSNLHVSDAFFVCTCDIACTCNITCDEVNCCMFVQVGCNFISVCTCFWNVRLQVQECWVW